MAAPKFAPGAPSGDVTSYRSPDHVPDAWSADRPGEIVGRQPSGPGLGFQGPDQGYALALAARLRPQLVLSDAERADDAVAGCTAIAMRRASSFGRAPVIHDVRVAFTIWGFLDQAPAAELVATRVGLFEGLADDHHYAERRHLVDSIPEATLRRSPTQIDADCRGDWRTVLGR